MGVLIRKQRGVHSLTGIAWLAAVILIVSMANSFVDTIWGIHLGNIFQNLSIVSFFSAFLTGVAFFAFFVLVPLIEKHSKSKLYLLSLFIVGIIYILFAINKNIYLFVILATIFVFLTSLRISVFGIIIRDKSSKKNLARNEGVIYTFLNIAWVVGPLIAGFVSEAYGIPIIFVLSAIFIFIALFVFKISKVKNNNIKNRDINIIKNFKSFFKSRDRVMAYIVLSGIYFWLILIYLYMPLYIVNAGLSIKWVGYFLFANAFPLILFEYATAKKAGKIGFKKIFRIGFFILFLTALLSFFFNNVYLVMVILSLSGIGMAFLEPTTEAYFFDILKSREEESKYYGPYNTSIDVSQFSSKILVGLILLFLPFKFVFLFFAFFMLAYFLVTFKIREVKEDLRRR